MANLISGVLWTDLNLGNGNDKVYISKADGADGDKLEGGTGSDAVVRRKEDAVIKGDHHDLPIDGDLMDRREEVLRNLR